MAIFKIDIDGVLRDSLPMMCTVYNKEYGTNITPDMVTDFNTEKIFTKCRENGISSGDFLFQLHGHEVFCYSDIIPGALEAMKTLKEAGHTIIIVSWQQSLNNKFDTLNWLDRYQIPYDTICFTKEKDLVKGDYMVDDNIGFLDTITKPTKPICIEAPYNIDKDRPYPKYKSLLDFVTQKLG